MKLKRTVAIALVIAGTCIVAIFALGLTSKPELGNNQVPNIEPADTSATEVPATAPQSVESPTSQSSSSPKPPTSTPPQTTAPTVTPTSPAPEPIACGKVNGPCSTSQIAAHNAASDCWVIYDGYYYIITSYVSQHPGGASVFNATTCGHDISPYLSGAKSSAGKRNTHKQSAYDTLFLYRVGPVEG